MSKYVRLTLARRVVIENMTLAGHTQIDIGLRLCRQLTTLPTIKCRCL